ncbi:MAG: TonB family protein [Caulobacter sp.]
MVAALLHSLLLLGQEPLPAELAPVPMVQSDARLPVAVEPMTPYTPKGEVTRPTWRVAPTGEQMARAYPRRASVLGIGGRAVISCLVHVSGELRQCEVVSEAPEGFGFGVAALRLSRGFRMNPMKDDGVEVSGAVVRAPVRFQVTQDLGAPADYQQALYCVGVHTMRLKLLPDDEVSRANLAPSRRLLESQASVEGIAPERKAADLSVALAGNEATFAWLEASPLHPSICLGAMSR